MLRSFVGWAEERSPTPPRPGCTARTAFVGLRGAQPNLRSPTVAQCADLRGPPCFLPDPAAKQTAEFGDPAADMFVFAHR